MEKAVYARLPGTLQRKTLMRRLHLFPDEVRLVDFDFSAFVYILFEINIPSMVLFIYNTFSNIHWCIIWDSLPNDNAI